ncbi:MAG TPA: polymer-forming cytoskeletal protein [Magnetospirillaceae bacterium]|nr:polymer-forming cytoskeletal protein [Magnetospirillaceae bacterium]
MTDVQAASVNEELIDTILAGDVEFSGTIVFRKPLMIKGRVSGTIRSESDLFIDAGAVVEAEITANRVSVRGSVKGNVVAKDRVDLYASGALVGDIKAPEVTMETGCRFNGICTMTGKKADAPTP